MNVDKRYQVFISSTFKDLQDERQAVLRGVLELNHMPAGMELFPAADDAAWQLIKDVIDYSDYYILIIGGRYGSLDEAGVGFTEKEYEYTLSKKTPVIALLHRNPENLPRARTETESSAWDKLRTFRSKVENNHTSSYWDNSEELKSKVIVGLTSAVKRRPTICWVRENQLSTSEANAEILALRRKIDELTVIGDIERTRPPEGIGHLAQGEDLMSFSYDFIEEDVEDDATYLETKHEELALSWDEIFAALAPRMINEESQSFLDKTLVAFLESRADSIQCYGNERRRVVSRMFGDNILDTCIIQFRALGLIKESVKTRSVKDSATYWTLTQYGDAQMTKLRAIPRRKMENANN